MRHFANAWADKLAGNRLVSRCLSSDRFILLVVLALWTVLALLYSLRTGDRERTHDLGQHLRYTRILAGEHRLPDPREFLPAHHPPFYYLVNGLLAPQSPRHVFYVRILSVVYGQITLAVLALLLRELRVRPLVQLFSLAFLATTPKFVFVFTTYNNDSMATMLSVAMMVVCLKLVKRWRWSSAALLFALSVVGIYTKLTALNVLLVCALLTGCAGYRSWIPRTNAVRVLVLLLSCGITLLPWLWFHNFARTHEFLPFNSHGMHHMRLEKSALRVVLTPPGVTDGEWSDPYSHLAEAQGTKRGSLLAYLFTTSVFGEFKFLEPAHAIAWTLVWIHLLVYLSGLRRSLASHETRLGLAVIALGVLSVARLVVHAPWSCNMDFRYIAWTWTGWTVLYAAALQRSLVTRKRACWSSGLVWLMAVGVGMHVYFLLHAESVLVQ
jgi:hypothetical protein